MKNLEISLKHIRSRKNQMILDQLFDLKSKEQELQDPNKDLRKKLQETSRICSMSPGRKVGIVAQVGMFFILIRDSFTTLIMILPCRLGKFFQVING